MGVAIVTRSDNPELLQKAEELRTLFPENNNDPTITIELSEELLKQNKVNIIDPEGEEVVRLNLRAVNLENNTCKPDLPMTTRNVVACILKHHTDDKYFILNWKTASWKSFVSGGRDQRSVEEAGLEEIREESGYQNISFITELDCEAFDKFYAPHKNVNRFINVKCGVFQLIDDERKELEEKEKQLHECVWKTKDEVRDALTIETNRFFWDVYTKDHSSLQGFKTYIDYKLKQHKPVVREFLSTVFIVQDNKVLLNFNHKCKIWVPVGGHIEKNELPCQSVIREAKEETGLDIEIVSIDKRPWDNLPQPINIRLDHITDDHKHINLTYLGKVMGGTFTNIADDGAPSRWFTKEELLTEPKEKMLENVKQWALEALNHLSS